MRKRRYEALLPLRYNDGRPIDAQFGGLSVQPNVVRGIWIHEGARYEDELLRYVVDVKELVMGFTVTRPGGTKDVEFESYARLLRQQGKDLGNLPRVPDPEQPRRRWVYVWNTREEAQHFADELQEQTGDNGWRVEPTAAPPSNGPFGPVLFQLARRSDGLALALHPLSLAMIQEAFPEAAPGATNAFVNMQTWGDFLKTQGKLSDLIEEIAPSLTGLSLHQLTDLGYAVIDADTDQTWVYVPPAATVQGQL
ncbi:MAG TPA: hypothetical protein VND64_19280 [Pirellulales bacterium]|nr:hypothetical protein [Pirellulales bacterium]